MADAPTPILWRNLPTWIRTTRRLDDRLYRKPGADAVGPSTRRPSRWWRAELRRPVFVIGAPRSGTSFLGDVVGSLPWISYHYEPPLTKAAVRYLAEGLWSEARWRRVVRLTYAWLLCRHGDGDLRFAEKTPQNCFAVAPLARAFPGARFVHIVRDGRDAALSYRDTPWLAAASAGSGKRETGGYPLGPVPRFWVEPERHHEFRSTTDLHRCIWAWRRFTEAALDGLATVAAEDQIEIRYEALVSDPRTQGDRLLDFLEARDASSRERLHESVARADASGVQRWRTAFQGDEARVVDREAGELLAGLGYPVGAAR